MFIHVLIVENCCKCDYINLSQAGYQLKTFGKNIYIYQWINCPFDAEIGEIIYN
jgi:hypothetical protein